MYRIWNEIVCDNCEEAIMLNNETKESMKKYARKQGWICGNIGDFCSKDCRKEYKAV